MRVPRFDIPHDVIVHTVLKSYNKTKSCLLSAQFALSLQDIVA